MATLNPSQIEAAKAFLYDMFANSGRIQVKNRVPRGYTSYDWQYFKFKVQKIVDALLVGRKVDYKKFIDLDDALTTVAKIRFRTSLVHQTAKIARKSADMIASYIAYFCSAKKIYWDNSLLTPLEMEEIKQTKFGKALWDYGCFVSQAGAPSAAPSKVRTSSTTGRVTGAPVKGYKSLGGLSSIVPNLISTSKHTPIQSILYCIEADKLGKNTPCVFITPVSQKGTAVSSISAEAVKIGSGNGYSDCKLWWGDLNTATYFLDECLKKFANSKFQNLHIAKARTDSNGYFIVSTDFGNALIKASRLNEEILEAIENERQVNEPITKKQEEGYSIKNIDVYEEAFDSCIN